ncbi:MAG: YkgJ family cysteine cluster protein [Woeseiaceae bacterium]
MKECNQCGKCCIKYSNGGLSALQSEIKHWDVFRSDIYAYVHEGKIWMHPETGEQLKICPWLENEKGSTKYTCAIYFDRPDDCKHYPVTIEQMINDECEMLESRDLTHPEQAQKKLDKLMADSRPSF